MRKYLLLIITALAASGLFAQVYDANSGNVCQAYNTRYYSFTAVPEATTNATLTVSWAYCGGDGFPDNGTLRLWLSTDDLSNYQVANTNNSGNGCSWVSNTYTISMAQINLARDLNGGDVEFYGYINDGCPGGVGCSFADPCFNLTLNFDSSPEASYTASSSAYCEGGTVVYESTSAGQIDDYTWDFGQDAIPAAAVGPGPHAVVYSSSGIKSVSLNISNAESSDLVEGEYEIFANPELSISESQEICFGQSITLEAISSETVSWNEGLGEGLSQEVSPEISTLYIASVIDENNCTASAEAMVTVNDLPMADAGEDQTICEGGSVTLMATGGTEYDWNEGLGDMSELEVSPTEDTVYTVVVTDENGCSSSDELTVTVNQNPIISINEPQEICLGESSVIQATSDYTVMWNEGLMDGYTQVVSPEESTLYIATAIDENDCSSSVEALVTVNPNPSVDITESQDICAGESVVLEVISDYTPVWNEGLAEGSSQEVSPEITTLYTAAVIDENNCFTEVETLVTVNPNPDLSILGYDDQVTYCQLDILSIEGVPAGGEFTGTTDLSDLDFVIFEEPGEQELTYSYTDENGCSSVLTLNFVTEICGGIEELKNEISVYPNPTSGIVNIDLGEAHVSISQIQIFDVQGKLVDLPLTRRGSLLNLDLSGYPNGVYTLSFSTEQDVVSKKIVLQK